jgi:hypothetical protein
MSLRRHPKRVWFDGELWTVHSIISPTKHEDFLVLSLPRNNSVHEDGTTPIDMVMLDAHNDLFYPDNQKVRAIMRRRRVEQKKRDDERETLTAEWLKACRSRGRDV